jgi:DNA-binding transcriptional ArsR family regulator
MEQLLSGLRACAEPTRLRILALVARGTFCVMEFTEILGQSAGAHARGRKRLVRAAAVRQRGGIARPRIAGQAARG